MHCPMLGNFWSMAQTAELMIRPIFHLKTQRREIGKEVYFLKKAQTTESVICY